jgi:hypothetical protein
VLALAAVLPACPDAVFAAGCHGPFFTEQVPPPVAFLAAHLAA